MQCCLPLSGTPQLLNVLQSKEDLEQISKAVSQLRGVYSIPVWERTRLHSLQAQAAPFTQRKWQGATRSPQVFVSFTL